MAPMVVPFIAKMVVGVVVGKIVGKVTGSELLGALAGGFAGMGMSFGAEGLTFANPLGAAEITAGTVQTGTAGAADVAGAAVDAGANITGGAGGAADVYSNAFQAGSADGLVTAGVPSVSAGVVTEAPSFLERAGSWLEANPKLAEIGMSAVQGMFTPDELDIIEAETGAKKRLRDTREAIDPASISGRLSEATKGIERPMQQEGLLTSSLESFDPGYSKNVNPNYQAMLDKSSLSPSEMIEEERNRSATGVRV